MKRRPTLNLSEDQLDMTMILMQRERYRSVTEVFVSFLRHWALSQQPHLMTGAWAALDAFQRDEIDRQLLAMLRAGKGKKGSWLKHLIEDTIKELLGDRAAEVTVDQVMNLLPGKALRKLEKDFGDAPKKVRCAKRRLKTSATSGRASR